MPAVKIDETLRMHYETYNFVAPWKNPETVLLVHGACEYTGVWYGWIPRLAQKFRVVCIDLPGFGKTTLPPEGYKVSLASLAGNINAFINKAGLGKVHLVGAKLAVSMVLKVAHEYPESVSTLTVTGLALSLDRMTATLTEYVKIIREGGMQAFAQATMKGRLGDVPAEMMDFWMKLYSRQSARWVSGLLEVARDWDLNKILPEIKTPTLILSGENPGLWTVADLRRWQEMMPSCELVTLPGTIHVAVTKPDECVSALVKFIDRVNAKGKKE